MKFKETENRNHTIRKLKFSQNLLDIILFMATLITLSVVLYKDIMDFLETGKTTPLLSEVLIYICIAYPLITILYDIYIQKRINKYLEEELKSYLEESVNTMFLTIEKDGKEEKSSKNCIYCGEELKEAGACAEDYGLHTPYIKDFYSKRVCAACDLTVTQTDRLLKWVIDSKGDDISIMCLQKHMKRVCKYWEDKNH